VCSVIQFLDLKIKAAFVSFHSSTKCTVDLECRFHTLRDSAVLKNSPTSLLEVDITGLKLILKKCKTEIKIRGAIKIRVFLDS